MYKPNLRLQLYISVHIFLKQVSFLEFGFSNLEFKRPIHPPPHMYKYVHSGKNLPHFTHFWNLDFKFGI